MMGIAISRFLDDIAQAFRCEKRKVVLCCVCALAGVVSGIVLFKISNYNWWYCNRCVFAEKLLYGGFFTIFLTYFFHAALICAFTSCALIVRQTHFLCYIALFFASLYFSANSCALFACAGVVLGLLYLLVMLAELAFNMLGCFLSACCVACRRSFVEAFCDNKMCVILQICGILFKIFMIFVLIRTISALI